jgi:lysozyme
MRGYRDHAYQDTGGVWTIGYGHTRGVKMGDSISHERAEMLLEADLMTAEKAVSELTRVYLTDNQFSALVSFVFNEGVGKFEKSTLLRELNTGHYAAVPSELAKWIYDDHKVQPGLVRRRAAEAALWRIT